MLDPLIGMIIPWAPNFAPRGWAFCAGQLLSISQNTALFSILGTTYGGDGQTTFALPDLRSRVAIHPGQGPGLSNYELSETAGVETVTLSLNTLPTHTHGVSQAPTLQINATTNNGNQPLPAPTHRLAATRLSTGQNVNLYSDSPANTQLGGLTLSGAPTTQNTGGNQPHENRQPYQVLNYIIALEGVFPSRN
jgi:microcystin-dependent protein